jgi:HlyD family secretion protein
MSTRLARWVRISLAVSVAVLLLAGGLAWWKARPMAVDVMSVAAQPLVRSLQFSARVATLSRVDVGSTLTGRVAAGAGGRGCHGAQGRRAAAPGHRRTGGRMDPGPGRRAAGRWRGWRACAAPAASRRARRWPRPMPTCCVRPGRAAACSGAGAQGFVSASRLDEARRAVDVARPSRPQPRRRPRPMTTPVPTPARPWRNWSWPVRAPRRRGRG